MLPDVVHNGSPSDVNNDNNQGNSPQSPPRTSSISNGKNSSNNREQWNNSGSIMIECSSTPPMIHNQNFKNNNNSSKTWQSNVHPFAHRNLQRYNNRKKVPSSAVLNQQVSSNSVSIVNISTNEDLEDSFEKIIKSADHSLHQAESILSSLRQRSKTLPAHASPPKNPEMASKNEDEFSSCSDQQSLGSDIETNIRKLEKTQAKINAALETFRSMKEGDQPEEGGVVAVAVASNSRPLMTSRGKKI